MLVDANDRASGILTERDVIGRITLPQRPSTSPVAQVASSPVLTLDEQASLSAAALTMVERNIRHIVITRNDRVVGRGQRAQLVRAAEKNPRGHQRCAGQCARSGGSGAVRQRHSSAFAKPCRARCRCGSADTIHQPLNDQLTQRLIALEAEHINWRISPGLRWCWLAFGSEGRHEQTISTDQDNGIIFALQTLPPTALSRMRKNGCSDSPAGQSGTGALWFSAVQGQYHGQQPGVDRDSITVAAAI